MTSTANQHRSAGAWPASPEEIAAADAQMAAAQDLQAELIKIVRSHVEAGMSPAATAETLMATAASAIAELEGGDDFAWCTAGHRLRRFGHDLANLFAQKIAHGDPQ